MISRVGKPLFVTRILILRTILDSGYAAYSASVIQSGRDGLISFDRVIIFTVAKTRHTSWN